MGCSSRFSYYAIPSPVCYASLGDLSLPCTPSTRSCTPSRSTLLPHVLIFDFLLQVISSGVPHSAGRPPSLPRALGHRILLLTSSCRMADATLLVVAVLDLRLKRPSSHTFARRFRSRHCLQVTQDLGELCAAKESLRRARPPQYVFTRLLTGSEMRLRISCRRDTLMEQGPGAPQLAVAIHVLDARGLMYAPQTSSSSSHVSIDEARRERLRRSWDRYPSIRGAPCSIKMDVDSNAFARTHCSRQCLRSQSRRPSIAHETLRLSSMHVEQSPPRAPPLGSGVRRTLAAGLLRYFGGRTQGRRRATTAPRGLWTPSAPCAPSWTRQAPHATSDTNAPGKTPGRFAGVTQNGQVHPRPARGRVPPARPPVRINSALRRRAPRCIQAPAHRVPVLWSRPCPHTALCPYMSLRGDQFTPPEYREFALPATRTRAPHRYVGLRRIARPRGLLRARATLRSARCTSDRCAVYFALELASVIGPC